MSANKIRIGSAWHDELQGTSGDDSLYGLDGADRLRGGAGNDHLDGGSGADMLYGGDGNDVLAVDTEDTVVDGGAGYDSVQMVGTAAYVDVSKFLSIEAVSGTADGDYLDGSMMTAGIILDGEAGYDYLLGGAGDDVLVGGSGSDFIDGNGGINTTIFEGNRSDYWFEDDGSGYLQVRDTRTGDFDTIGHIEIFKFADATMTLAQLTASFDETLIGTAADDVLDGGAGADVLKGMAGNDTLYGGSGDDRLEGGSGDDYLYDTSGDDTAVLSGARSDYFVEQIGEGQFKISDQRGIDGVDTIFNIEKVQFADGALLASDLLRTEPGRTFVGTDQADALQGAWGNDVLLGFAGNDFLFGNKGDDALDGGAGDDFLIGSEGDDSIAGGDGNDVAILSGLQADYSIEAIDATHVRVTDLRSEGDGKDVLSGVESLGFSNGFVVSLGSFMPQTTVSDLVV